MVREDKMKNKIIKSISRVNYLLLLLAITSVSICGQKSTSLDSTEAARRRLFEIEREARKEVSRSAVAISILDLIKANDSAWKLEKATYGAKRERIDSSTMELVYKKGKLSVAFVIYEYDTLEEMKESDKEASKIGRSAGRAVEYNRFGDSGEKIYGDGDIFWMLTFKRDRFRVLVVARKEKNAEYFAAFIEKAIEELLGNSKLVK